MPEWIQLALSIGLIILVGLAMIVAVSFRPIDILQHQRALRYRNGKFDRVLGSGRHWASRYFHHLQRVDMRLQFVTIAGQEVLSADNISLKISLAASYRIEDPYRSYNETANFQEALYLALQLQLRELVAALPIDDLLVKRREIGEALLAGAKPKAAEFGLALVSADIKDIMFPGELKNVFAQVVNARNEGLALLERARGESAALRNLANTARLLENNPALLQLRLLQTLHRGSNNSIILKMPENDDTLMAAQKKPGAGGNREE